MSKNPIHPCIVFGGFWTKVKGSAAGKTGGKTRHICFKDRRVSISGIYSKSKAKSPIPVSDLSHDLGVMVKSGSKGQIL